MPLVQRKPLLKFGKSIAQTVDLEWLVFDGHEPLSLSI
jgi:hypothetical protein